MYQVQNAKSLLGQRRGRRPRGQRVSRTVVLLGLTSMFTDISSEMVVAILPLYLVFGLGLSPVQFGVVDGLYQGVSALVRIAAGVVSDRWRRHKDVAVAGYGLSALTRLAVPLVGGAWTAIGAIVMVDRIGKGIRTAPRDAMIALSSRRDELGAAFGVHRALDTAGAMLGPLVAFGILALAPRGYDAVFVASFCFAIVGLAILWLFVDRDPGVDDRAEPVPPQRPKRPPSLRDALALLGRGRFRLLALVSMGLALATVSDAFVYLSLQQRLSFDVTLLPLLYIGTALVFMLLAVPAGRLADRIGRLRMFLAGHVLLVVLYLMLLLPAAGAWQAVAALLLLGAYYAATDGVLMALASTLLPASMQATGMAVIVTGTSAGRLLSAITFGALWTWAGTDVALIAFAATLAAAVTIAALLPIGDGGTGDAAVA